MKISKDWFQLYEKIIKYIENEGIEIEKTSTVFARSGGNPRVIRKSSICLRRDYASPQIEEVKKSLRKIRDCDLISTRKYRRGDDLVEALQCYSVTACNPEKSPLPDPAKKEDSEYASSFKRDVASWRRKNMALIEEVRVYYNT